jgi:uncharacterized repeat protein (TIGR03803 family)
VRVDGSGNVFVIDACANKVKEILATVGGRLGACLSASLLAACGGGSFSSSTTMPITPQAGEPTFARQPLKSGTEQVVYSFKGPAGKDGAEPGAGLSAINGVLYGTTFTGGRCDIQGYCWGTVFSVSTSGAETVLHRFKNTPDGAYPDGYGGLIAINGALYGTTTEGGRTASSSTGAVFEVSTSGKERVLHSFAGCDGITGSGVCDGTFPFAGLINVKGKLYGTTAEGGGTHFIRGYGTVFEMNASGTESVLSYFKGYPNDGGYPDAGLINVNGVLYGTTVHGGVNSCGSADLGCGAIFKVTTSGTETMLHSFGGAQDGLYPYAGLINVKGKLYGTTFAGGMGAPGACDLNSTGCGTIFEISTSGKERVLYRFIAGSDGWGPASTLIAVNGELYGTTSYGGTSGSECPYGCGTVFKIKTSGKGYAVLYRFTGGADGAFPFTGGLTALNGALYGTTTEGGSCAGYAHACGTVFEVTP